MTIEHNAILTPVLTAGRENERGTALGMKWMGDLDRGDCVIVTMTSSC
jgi:hypothetical protein